VLARPDTFCHLQARGNKVSICIPTAHIHEAVARLIPIGLAPSRAISDRLYAMDFEVSGDVVQISHERSVRTADFIHHGSAHHLVARRYADRGYATSDPRTHQEEGLIVCSAFLGATTVGTIAVRFESSRGLNADQIFGTELSEMRSAGYTLCEFSRLALDQGMGDSKEVLAQLFHLAYLHAYRLAGCEILVIEVNPRHVAFYRRMLGFKVCSEARMNPRVNAPAVLMSLDLSHACEQIGRLGGKSELAATSRSLYPYFYGPEEEAAILTKLRQ
jgi:hypothetical protein